MHTPTYIIGIDEVGRGPIAGPVTVAALAVRVGSHPPVLEVSEDSKILSPEERQYIYNEALSVRNKDVWFFVASVSAQTIDRIGINKAIGRAIRLTLKRLEAAGIHADNSFVYLDGGLAAPHEYKQKTIIKGDSKVKVISLASVLAKVTRDAYMTRIARTLTGYGFELHKGYGTQLHFDRIRAQGFSSIHRMTFCKNP